MKNGEKNYRTFMKDLISQANEHNFILELMAICKTGRGMMHSILFRER